ncbi:MAG: farnesyltranstransferase [Candidatus Puniceispirillum sp.]|nr:farnesyltranstransferase [Candidatus Puniceispirillum sp.]
MTQSALQVEIQTPSLASLQQLVNKDMGRVNEVMQRALASSVPLIPELGTHLMVAGGKRLRPMLTLAASHMCGAPLEDAAQLAACVEFIHAATLLHDDVIDESLLRRGRPTANAVWGNKASVLVGDFLFARAFELMVAQGSLEVLALLSATSVRLSEGEVLQLSMTGDLSVTRQGCVDIMSAKTAPLFEAATGVAGILAGVDTVQKQGLLTYGRALGVCFQIIDDILDYQGGDASFGKAVGGDLLERKVTLPVVLAYEKGSTSEQQFWRDVYDAGADQKEHLPKVLSLLSKYNAFDEAHRIAKGYGQEALGALSVFQDSPAKAALEETVHFSLLRQN